jgi:hypothetical protein
MLASPVRRALWALIPLAAALLAVLENFPSSVLADARRTLALLFKDLATLRDDAALFTCVDDLRWRGPTGDWPAWAERLGDERLTASCRAAQPAE